MKIGTGSTPQIYLASHQLGTTDLQHHKGKGH